jgi:glycosyltransferase involved in cell wall biosynthesis
MWHGKTIAVILPTYRERETIRATIDGFAALGVVDDILVVNNNAQEGTSEEVAQSSGREVVEPRQGYGAAIQRGIRETSADLICICEPDGTFDPADLWKLLSYSEDFDFVYGSRTVREFIWSGANMGRFLRWGNWAVAKAIEVTFNTPQLSDVGCTLRLVKGDAARELLAYYSIDDGAFGPEMMLLSILSGWRIVQIPVNYRARGGGSGETETIVKAFRIGIQMIALITRYRAISGRVRRGLRVGGVVGRPPVPPGAARAGGEPVHLLPALRVEYWRGGRTRQRNHQQP